MIIETPPPPKKRSHGQPEAKIQAESFAWVWNEYPQYRGLVFAVTNQNERSGDLGKKAQLISGAMRKNLGLVAGVSDLICLIPRGKYHGLMLECKTESGTQKPPQIWWQGVVEPQGYLYKIFRSVDEFKEIIQWYLNL